MLPQHLVVDLPSFDKTVVISHFTWQKNILQCIKLRHLFVVVSSLWILDPCVFNPLF